DFGFFVDATFASTPPSVGPQAQLGVAIVDSVASGNEGIGFVVKAPAGSAIITVLDVVRSTASGNGTAFQADGRAFLVLGQSLVVGNGVDLSLINGGVGFTYGDNMFNFNGPSGASLTSLPKR